MEENHFEAPKSDIVTDIKQDAQELASRRSRLGASIIDSIILLAIIMPLMFGLGWFTKLIENDGLSILFTLAMGILSLVLFCLINFKYLSNDGQTIGKKLVGIKIVDMDGAKADFKTHILKRYLVYFIPNNIPVVGYLFFYINVLFILRKDKRCLHDLIAHTQVIEC